MKIEMEHVTKRYGQTAVLQDFSILFPENAFVCFFGTSGCGKTTLMHILSGILTPDSGTVSGLDGVKKSVVFQEDRLLPQISILDNLLAVKNDSKKALSLLEALALSACKHKLPCQLSGGMKRRVALARALLFDGGIYFLDEPFKGLDPGLKNEAMDVIKCAIGATPCFLITHELTEAEHLCDFIFHLRGGPLEIARIEQKNGGFLF